MADADGALATAATDLDERDQIVGFSITLPGDRPLSASASSDERG